jgi:hypothetical protein
LNIRLVIDQEQLVSHRGRLGNEAKFSNCKVFMDNLTAHDAE